MCSICKKFKKGSITTDEARDELDEQLEFLSEEHVEEIEQMLFEAEDTYEYMMERRREQLGLEDEDREYAPEEDLYEEIDPDDEDDE
jgi:thioredoxin-related protein